MDLEKLTPKQKIIGGVICVAILLAVIIIPKIQNQIIEEPTTEIFQDEKDERKSDVQKRYVEITGQVISPGVYEITGDILVIELIDLAGGLTSGADLQIVHRDIPLSTFVEPNQKVYIPGTFESASSSQSSGGATISGKVSINNASSEQLEALTGIGPATAAKIISARPYSKIEDLKNVEGIGEKTYNNIVTMITL